MIVIGAGPIAIEMAQAFSRLGTKVDVVQRSGQILSREDNDLADLAMKILQQEGVTFHLNARIVAAIESAGRIKLLLNAKGKPLGIQILGHHAGELLGEWVAAFNGRTSVATLAAAMHPYPTLGEINKRVSSAYF